jgi:hypothetical protein
MIVQIPMENSVGKSKDCGSGNTWLYIIPLLIPILLIRIPPLTSTFICVAMYVLLSNYFLMNIEIKKIDAQ